MGEAVKVDAMGKECPIPVVMTLKAIQGMSGAGQVVTSVDNAIAVENLKKLAADKGLKASVNELAADHFEVTIDVAAGTVVAEGEPESATCLVPQDNVVVQISSDKMGVGDDKLGAQLMKAFIYALTQQEELPRTVLLYNGGARLSCEGSLSLEDLQSLADRGVEVLTCGTCVNYYGIADKVRVGEITNMYVICEKLMKASHVVRP
jgi:selenium metabolism protein YedF